MSTQAITIVEVGPRDGLQSEPEVLATDTKVQFIQKAIDAGITRLEVASFVHPKLVPQMADAEALIEKLPQVGGVSYIGLVMNERGLDRALATNVHEIGMVVVASDTYNRKNQGVGTDESVAAWQAIGKRAKENDRVANVMISSAFGCPYEGEVRPERVVELAKQVTELGPAELGIADSIGVAVPNQVTDLLGRVREVIGDIPLRCHFHNTRNTGLANAQAAVDAGVSYLDASIGGVSVDAHLHQRRRVIFRPMTCCTCLIGPAFKRVYHLSKLFPSAIGLRPNWAAEYLQCCQRQAVSRQVRRPERSWTQNAGQANSSHQLCRSRPGRGDAAFRGNSAACAVRSCRSRAAWRSRRAQQAGRQLARIGSPLRHELCTWKAS